MWRFDASTKTVQPRCPLKQPAGINYKRINQPIDQFTWPNISEIISPPQRKILTKYYTFTTYLRRRRQRRRKKILQIKKYGSNPLLIPHPKNISNRWNTIPPTDLIGSTPPPPSSISLSLSLSLPTSFGKCPWPVTLTPPDARCGATPQVEYVTGIIIIINQSICQNGRIARAWTRLIHFSAPLQLDLRVAGMCRLLQSGYHLLIEPIPRQLFAHLLPPPTLSPIQKEFFFYWLEFHQIKNKSPWSSFIGQFCRWWVWIASEINQGQVDSSQPNSIIRHQINRILFESVRLP